MSRKHSGVFAKNVLYIILVLHILTQTAEKNQRKSPFVWNPLQYRKVSKWKLGRNQLLPAGEEKGNKEIYRTWAHNIKKATLKYKNFQALEMMTSWWRKWWIQWWQIT